MSNANDEKSTIIDSDLNQIRALRCKVAELTKQIERLAGPQERGNRGRPFHRGTAAGKAIVYWMDAEYLLLLDLESESDDDSDSEAIALCHELRQRRFWVADYIKRREDLGEFRLYYELDDDRFANYFRMSRIQFGQLQNILATSLTGKNSNCRSCLPVDLKLAVCLRFLNTGDSFRTIGFSYRLGERTVAKIVVDVTEAMYTHLQTMYLPTPSTEQWRTIGAAFGENWQFPNCLGAIDETVDKVVKATVVLHNYLGRTGGHNYSDEDISKAMQETDNQLLNLPRIGNNPSSEAFLVRDMFCNYFMNVGQVEWQNRVNQI
ncbi:hypothetical protein JTE90_015975 [Oedothorax gibbosus]|uniref:Nuclease HARBI1 n=1 Tax=Oedothorax gibbosus TaxID=931172 RepID=A0AAV6VRA6_9ARAC|nr:hypothetical protein JTE90_015975 [Oedothorax gibbosus]